MMLAVIALVYQSLSAPAELTVEPVHLKTFASFNRVRYADAHFNCRLLITPCEV